MDVEWGEDILDCLAAIVNEIVSNAFVDKRKGQLLILFVNWKVREGGSKVRKKVEVKWKKGYENGIWNSKERYEWRGNIVL